MHAGHHQTRSLFDSALEALELNGTQRRSVLDALPAPVYLTDPDGLVTYWNRACAEFAGREPQLGKDRWCVTWQSILRRRTSAP